MTPAKKYERSERVLAEKLAHEVHYRAVYASAEDRSAASVAALVRAVEIATPDLPPSLRAQLFLRDPA